MIYVIDNGQSYSNQTLYFVEAPEDFGAWFNEVYQPWVESAEYRPLMIVATTSALAWRPLLPYTPRPAKSLGLPIEDHPMKEFGTMDVVKFLKCKDVVQKRDGKPRSRYRLEVA
jgi:hypothetical protein